MRHSYILVFFSLLLMSFGPPCDGWSLLPSSHPSSHRHTTAAADGRDLWDPFKVLEQIPLELERDGIISLPRVDWKETPEGHVITLEVPGLDKGELKIEFLENGVLRVSGERKKEEEKDGDRWHCIERAYGKFWRQFRLPDNVDVESIKAKLENGVLKIFFSKVSPDKMKGPKVVAIDISSEGGAELGSGGAGGNKNQAKGEL